MQIACICGLTRNELIEKTIPFYDITTRQAAIVANHVYRKHIQDFWAIPGIPNKLKEVLYGNFITGLFPPGERIASSDGSVKYLFVNGMGQKFETVFIPEGKRNTVCVSTQSGCRMGCPFCATGKYGFHGNLTAGDIVNQVTSITEAAKVNHVVFMGMGEPMDNPDNVMKACDILTAEWGLSVSAANITVSTVGLQPATGLFLERSNCNLALSLFSPFPEERKSFVAAERISPASEIIAIMKSFPAVRKRRFSIAYVMMEGINDSDRHLEEIITILGNSRIRINLLPYHNSGDNNLVSSTMERMMHFKHQLNASGISASVRKSRGQDINAACGLLASDLSKEESGSAVSRSVVY